MYAASLYGGFLVMGHRVGSRALGVAVALTLFALPLHAQEMPPDNSDESNETTPPGETSPPATEVVPPGPTAQPTPQAGPPPALSTQAPPTCSAAQTQPAPSAVPGRPPIPSPRPGPAQTVVPLFCRPF